MKTLHLSIIVFLVASLVAVNSAAFADGSTSYGGLTGFRQAYFQGNHGSYPIWYKLTNGTVVSALLDLPAKALLFMINTSSDGQLIVELPRSIIDSKNQNADKPYFVGLGGITTGLSQVNATETSDDYLRTLKIGFTKNTDEIEIVGTFFVENYSSMTKHSSILLSPLKQFKSGVAAKDVKCKEGLQFIMKNENGQPACVTPHTFDELMTRGWGIMPLGGLPTYHDTSNDIAISYNYTLYDNGAFHVKQSQNFTLMLDVTSNPVNVPVTLYTAPHSGFTKTNGIDFKLSDTMVNTPAKVMLYMSVSKDATPSTYGEAVRLNDTDSGSVTYLFYVTVK